MLRKIINFLFDSGYQVVTWVWIATSISSFFFFAGKPSGQRGQGMVWSALSLCVAVAVMILLLAKRYFFDTQGRPKISLESATIAFTSNRPPRIAIGVKNRGDLTAHNILWRGADYVTSYDFPGPLPYSRPDEVDRQRDLIAGAELTAITMHGVPITPAELIGLGSGKLRFWHYTDATYEDKSGNEYPFDICLIYEREMGSAMRIAPPEYWPKKND